MGAPAFPTLPSHAYSTNASGVVIRVFHAFARTDFEPSEEVAQALRAGVRGAERVEVRGHTDSNVVNPIDRLIAVERAEKARTWLINNGAEPAKISTRHFTAGHFLTENRTRQGRALNRRVEIDIHNPQLTGNQVALRD
jgi:flagellar motor protein MotB